jgi:phosphoesterase RecJ-like protein
VLPTATVNLIDHALDGANKVVAITHVSPDGDAISSLVAMGLALRQLDKQVTMVCDDGLPDRFRYLPLSNQVQTEPDGDYDLIIALDAGDSQRLGKAFADLPQPRPSIINIDHHITNSYYGDINLVVPDASATVEILFNLFPELGIEITSDLATSLLSGLVTDTLGFRTANVSSVTLRTASALVDAGADLFLVTAKALTLKPFSTLLMWQKGLNNVQLEDGVIWTSISYQERLETGYEDTSSFGLGNMLAEVNEAVMSAVFLELANGRVKVGFRSRPPFKVSQLARDLGGGGHHLASGCTLDGPLEEVVQLVVKWSKESIREQRVTLEVPALEVGV